jgi:hypothetical protein
MSTPSTPVCRSASTRDSKALGAAQNRNLDRWVTSVGCHSGSPVSEATDCAQLLSCPSWFHRQAPSAAASACWHTPAVPLVVPMVLQTSDFIILAEDSTLYALVVTGTGEASASQHTLCTIPGKAGQGHCTGAALADVDVPGHPYSREHLTAGDYRSSATPLCLSGSI